MQELLGREKTEAGLDALREQLRRLERGERIAEQTDDSESARLRRRIENLEAIVTSRDWDLLDADFRRADSADSTPLLNDVLDTEDDSAERTERLARRVR